METSIDECGNQNHIATELIKEKNCLPIALKLNRH